MAKKFLEHLDLNQNELQNAVEQNLATAPSSPKKGQHYFNTTDNKAYIYDGTNWKDTTSEGAVYNFSTGLTENTATHTVTLNKASKADLGGVIVGNNMTVASNGLIDVPAATNTQIGVIQLATDAEATAGTDEAKAINSKQLKTGLDTKIGKTDLSVDSASANYLEYDNTTGKFKAKVDTTVGTVATNLVTSGAVQTAINNALVGGMVYKGSWDSTSQTDYSSIAKPVKKGYMYLVTGTGATIGGVEWKAGDYLVINKDVSTSGTIGNSDVEKIDNTESTDIVKLDATQTLTNKTINAANNTISDLETTNLKSGVLQTTIRAAASATDSALASEKAIRTELDTKTGKLTAQNGVLTASGGVATWTISNTLATADVIVSIHEVATGDEVFAGITKSAASIIVKFNATANIAADTYKCVIIG